MLDNDQKKDRPDLGAAFIATNKKTPQSYDMSGTIVVDGVKHKFGAYKQKASGKGKMPEGTEFFKHFKVNFAISSFEILSLDLFPGKIILGFRIIPFKLTLCRINSSNHYVITSEVFW